MSAITGISMLQPIQTAGKTAEAEQIAGNAVYNNKQNAESDFGKFLSDALQKVDNLQKDADKAALEMAAGQVQDLHTVVIAMEKASLAMSLTVEVRNKVLDAYHEVMRMQM